MFKRNRFLVSITFATCLVTTGFANADSGISSAPFANDSALRQFSDSLMGLLSIGKIEEARQFAIRNSHLDDPVVQQNLNDVFDAIKGNPLTDTEPTVSYVQTSKFGRSFIRHQYTLNSANIAMRCMMTYRRKTDGWRLNQLWCNRSAVESP